MPADVTWSPASALPSRELVAEHHTLMNREFVEGYINAVHDATEGKMWCYNEKHQVPSLEAIWDASQAGLRGLSPKQRQRNASDLLGEIWSARWPCHDHGRKK